MSDPLFGSKVDGQPCYPESEEATKRSHSDQPETKILNSGGDNHEELGETTCFLLEPKKTKI